MDEKEQTADKSAMVPKWDLIIKPRSGWFELNLGDLWRYRDLIFMFVKRDLVVTYKQTILGPLWFLIQPLFSTVIFTVIFGNVAKLPTDNVPPFLFYMAGTTAWGYFASCITGTSNTFVANAGIFGKVYFPRLTVPISIVISNLFRFSIQFILFLGFYFYFKNDNSAFAFNRSIFLLPLLILEMAILGLGVGILVSSMVTKYRDLNILMGFGVQLWMYACPIIYPVSQVPEKYRAIYMLNPMASIIELFKFAFFGVGVINMHDILTGWIVTFTVLIAGLLLFTRIERTFMDTV
ncbi:MAG: ABC transporter permease [Turneriella sp.]|nr:ABC transporter permease [Turneriella sp.]